MCLVCKQIVLYSIGGIMTIYLEQHIVQMATSGALAAMEPLNPIFHDFLTQVGCYLTNGVCYFGF